VKFYCNEVCVFISQHNWFPVVFNFIVGLWISSIKYDTHKMKKKSIEEERKKKKTQTLMLIYAISQTILETVYFESVMK
jgi:hypothetical protein